MKRSREAKSIRLNPKALDLLDEVYRRLPTVQCQGMCHQACGPIFLTQTEADRISAHVGRRPLAVVPADAASYEQVPPCPLLTADKRCSVYAIRPFICRAFGVAEGLLCPYGCKPTAILSKDAFRKVQRQIALLTGDVVSFHQIQNSGKIPVDPRPGRE